MQNKRSGTSTGDKEKNFRLLGFKRPLSIERALQDFKCLHERVINYEFGSHNDTNCEFIERACCLTFLLLCEGGVMTASPIKKIESLLISTENAEDGFIRWSAEKNLLSTKKITSGPRQFIYTPAQVHLLAFLKFRKDEMQAQELDILFPQVSKDLITEAKAHLVWLKSVKQKPSWTAIFQAFLKYNLNIISPLAVKKELGFSIADFREIAMLFLYRKEEPILLEARRYSVTYPSMPKAQFQSLIKTSNKSKANEFASAGQYNSLEEAEEYCIKERNSEPKLSFQIPTGAVTTYRDLALREVRKFVKVVADTEMPFPEAVRKGESFLNYELFNAGNSIEAHYLLEWLIDKFKLGNHKGNQLSTIATEAQRLFYFTDSLNLSGFSDISTDDLILFLSQYSSIASVKNYLSTFKSFYNYLKVNANLPLQNIHWNSSSLRFSKSFRENEIITEVQFQHLLTKCSASTLFSQMQMKLILILLRRAGLRCCEIALLRFVDFTSFSDLRLSINFTKSAAGKRDLPLNLLFSQSELTLFQNFYKPLFLKSLSDVTGFYNPFLSDGNNRPYSPEQIGSEVTKVMKAAGLYSQTAHNLRRAFATSLMFAWWLWKTRSRVVRYGVPNDWTRKALHQFCRPEIEARTVTFLDDIRALLGHASLDVTFERYIHNLDLITADAVKLNESAVAPMEINISLAAKLAGCTPRNLRSFIPAEERRPDGKDRRKTNIDLSVLKDYLINSSK